MSAVNRDSPTFRVHRDPGDETDHFTLDDDVTTYSPVDADEWRFVPESQIRVWENAWGGYTRSEQTEAMERLSATVDYAFNPGDGDGDQGSILESAILSAARFISRWPCTCTEDEDCDRCAALGRSSNKRHDR